MNKEQISTIIDQAISKLYEKDSLLITDDLSERSISHRLSVYLEGQFPGYVIDCEYNGYAMADNNRKYIKTLRKSLHLLGRLKVDDEENEILSRYVFPDVIVHKRNSNENKLIIEIKKEKNRDIEYDCLKLHCYTTNKMDNELRYDLGLLVIFDTGKEEPNHTVLWYENGIPISEDKIIF